MEAERSPPSLPPSWELAGKEPAREITVSEQRRDPTSLVQAGPRVDATGRGQSDWQLFCLWGRDP